MAGKQRPEAIREAILRTIPGNPRSVVRLVAQELQTSRQNVHKHLQSLVEEGFVEASARTKARSYRLVVTSSEQFAIPLEGLQEDLLWTERIQPHVKVTASNVMGIWEYGISEMVNNAIDHSSGKELSVQIERTAVTTEVVVADDGIGIFRNIQRAFGLEDERHAMLELAKGKLTTDPERHTGEGIFFASRMFDEFVILSGGTAFSHQGDEVEDYILERDQPRSGTAVFMKISDKSTRTTKDVFEKYTTPEADYGFTRTVVPVRLAKTGSENLVSRSQARRLLARFERFSVVILDFDGVGEIGPAFADEVFRVFPGHHPEVTIEFTNAGPAVRAMIRRAKKSPKAPSKKS